MILAAAAQCLMAVKTKNKMYKTIMAFGSLHTASNALGHNHWLGCDPSHAVTHGILTAAIG